MGIISRLFGKTQPAIKDAQRIYQSLLGQSRKPEFFGEDKVPDTYKGRIDVITLHMSIVMHGLRAHGDNGGKLSQALFDAMVDDFDIALRDEGLTDSGVKRRIKPMIRHFYAGLKSISEALESQDLTDLLSAQAMDDASPEFKENYAAYAIKFHEAVAPLSLGDIALARFKYPQTPS